MTPMGKRMLFLLTVFIVLLVSIFVIAWISKTYIFTQLEPAFLGALIAAAGTIFAACIAYTAASQNLEMASKTAEDNAKQRLENEKQQKRFQLQQAVTELQQARDVLAYLDRLLNQFDGASESGDRDFVAYMADVDRAGGIVQYMGPIPQGLYAKVQELFMRFNNMRGPLNMLNNGRPAAETANERAAINRSIRDRIADVRKLRGEVDEDVRRRERLVDAMERQG
jgi:hypothetical protein